MKETTIGPHAEIRILSEGRVFVAVFDGDVDANMVRQFARTQAGFAEEARRPILTFSLIRGGSPNVSEEIRDASARFLKNAMAYTEASAIVLDVPGMLGVIIRSVVTGILLVARTPYSSKVLAHQADAEVWLRRVSTFDSADSDALKRLLARLGD